jgi:hypothetical protein
MPILNLLESGHFDLAELHTLGATRLERTAVRAAVHAGRHSGNSPKPARCKVVRHGSEQTNAVRMLGPVKHMLFWADFNNTARIHYGNLVSD